MKARPFFAAGAIFVLSLASAALLFHSSPEPKKAAKAPSSPIAIPADINPNEILTWDCEFPEYKPTSITLTCADGGWQVGKISWQTWNKDGATGTGTFYENLCEPSCAEGKVVNEAVTLRLSTITPWKEKYYFRTLDISTKGGQDFAWGRSGSLQWDVMEFAEGFDNG